MFRSQPPSVQPADAARLRRELLRLDPWSFWTVEIESDATFAVLGVTGAFAIAPCGLGGYLVAEGRKLLVDGVPVGGFRELRRVAKRLRGELIGIGASSRGVVPVLCLTRAVAGAPRDHGGVRVVRARDLAREITDRERVLDPSTAERLASRIGRVLSGRVDRPPDYG